MKARCYNCKFYNKSQEMTCQNPELSLEQRKALAEIGMCKFGVSKNDYRLEMIDIRKTLTLEEMNWVNSAMEGRRKQPTVMWLLWLFTGTLGGHRYYLGDSRYGIWMTAVWLICIFTGFTSELTGLLCIPAIWAIIDAFNINARLESINLLVEMNTINYIKGYSKEI